MEWAFRAPSTLKQRLGAAVRRRRPSPPWSRGPGRRVLREAGAAPLPGGHGPAGPRALRPPGRPLRRRRGEDLDRRHVGRRAVRPLVQPAGLRDGEVADLPRAAGQAVGRTGPPAGRNGPVRSPTTCPARSPTSTRESRSPGCGPGRRSRRRRARARPTEVAQQRSLSASLRTAPRSVPAIPRGAAGRASPGAWPPPEGRGADRGRRRR